MDRGVGLDRSGSRPWRLLWAVVGAVAVLSPVAMASPALAPVDPAIAARLPAYCRYDVDVRSQANPHRALLDAVSYLDAVCPFVAGRDATTRVYRLRTGASCADQAPRGLKIAAVRQLDGRTGRSEMSCAIGNHYYPPPAGSHGGRTIFVHYVSPDGFAGSFRDLLETSLFIEHGGGPFVAADVSNSNADVYGCFEMIPGGAIGPIEYLRLIGHPVPDNAVEEDVTGHDCAALAKARYHIPDVPEGPRTAEFSVWLIGTERNRTDRAFRTAFVMGFWAAHVTPRQGRYFTPGKNIVLHARDGAAFSVAIGKRQMMIMTRSLTPGLCEALWNASVRTHAAITTSQTDLMALMPPDVAAPPDHGALPRVPVTSATDLCALLQPGFDDWRAYVSPAPVDLKDLDDENYSVG